VATRSDSMSLFSLSSSATSPLCRTAYSCALVAASLAKTARSLDCTTSSFAFYESSQATWASPFARETLLSILERVIRASVRAASLSFFSSKAAVRAL